MNASHTPALFNNSKTNIPQSAQCNSSLVILPPDSAIRHNDTQLVKGWLASKNDLHNYSDESFRVRTMTLFQFGDYVSEVESLLEDLKNLEKLQKNTTGEEYTSILVAEIQKNKSQVDQLLELLGSSEVQNEIKTKLRQRKKKRLRIRRLKRKQLKQKEEKLANRQRLHSEIDSRLEKIAEDILNEKSIKEVTAEVDMVLGEVRRKIVEGKRSIAMLESLQELRKLRLEKALETGRLVPEDSTEMFHKNIDAMLILLNNQLGHYSEEKRVLRAIVQMEYDNKQVLTQEKPSQISNNDFRNNVCYEEKDVADIIQIRRDWDLYIVQSGGEYLPLSYPIPTAPTSQEWNKYLINTTQNTEGNHNK